MKRKLFIIVALLGFVLTSSASWAFAPQTFQQLIDKALSDRDAAKTALSQKKTDKDSYKADIATQKSNIAAAINSLATAKGDLITLQAQKVADKGNPALVKSDMQQINQKRADIQGYLLDKQVARQNVMADLASISAVWTDIQGLNSQLVALQNQLSTYYDLANRCGPSAISPC